MYICCYHHFIFSNKNELHRGYIFYVTTSVLLLLLLDQAHYQDRTIVWGCGGGHPRYIDRGGNRTSIDMSSYNGNPTLGLHITKFWFLALVLGRNVVCILNFLVQRVFALSTLFRFDGCRTSTDLSLLRHHIQSLLSFYRLPLCHVCDRKSRYLDLKAAMKWVTTSLVFTICMQSVLALPQGSINSQSSNVSNSLPTATLPISTAFNSSVPLVQSTSTNAVPDTTGVSTIFEFCVAS